MQSSDQTVCLNMQPYDGHGKESNPTLSPQTRNLTVQEPKDYILWSLFSFFYLNSCCCCLSFIALIFSIKARDRKMVGDYRGADSYGSTAKHLNITVLLLTLLAFIILIIVAATKFSGL